MKTGRNILLTLHCGIVTTALLSVLLLSACSKEDANTPVMSFQAIPVSDTLKGMIGENTLLTNNRTWYIDGWVYVANEATLSIEPGTLLKVLNSGYKRVNGGLVITRGAKIIAAGTSYAPVTMTCSDTMTICSAVKMGVVLLGKAPVKQVLPIAPGFDGINGGLIYGGKEVADSSGVLQHLKIIYPSTQHKQAVPGDSLTVGLFPMGMGDRTVLKDITLRQITPAIQVKLK